MKIVKSKLYEKQKEKLIASEKLTEAQINEAEALFEKTPTDPKLRPHKITCKKDKRRRSLTVPSTAYRILYTDGGDTAVFQMIIHHRKYDRINKKC